MTVCLFRFEDNFEPEGKVEEGKEYEAALDHINGAKSLFFSYRRHLIPCMVKYYRYPHKDEKVSLYIHNGINAKDGIDVGSFSSKYAAQKFFEEKCPYKPFPEEYPSIEDGEVLMKSKLKDGIELRFGYAVYYLVLLTILLTAESSNYEEVLERIANGLKDFDLYAKLSYYRIHEITAEGIQTAKTILHYFYEYDRHFFSIEEIMKMEQWNTTFSTETERNDFLKVLYERFRPHTKFVYSISKYDDTRYYSTDMWCIKDIVHAYVNTNNKFSTLMNMHEAKQIDIGYFAELEQKPGYESCEFDMDNDELTVIRADGVLKVVSNASTKTAKQIMDVIQK